MAPTQFTRWSERLIAKNAKLRQELSNHGIDRDTAVTPETLSDLLANDETPVHELRDACELLNTQNKELAVELENAQTTARYERTLEFFKSKGVADPETVTEMVGDRDPVQVYEIFGPNLKHTRDSDSDRD